MKKLIERYKQELMEYSKAAHTEPIKDFGFPEMTEEPPATIIEPEQAEAEAPAETSVESAVEREEPLSGRAPQVIGYGGEEILAQFNNIFGEQPTEDNYADYEEEYGGVSTVTPEQAEELDDPPVSGGSPEEQLANRNFETEEPTQNDPDDVRPLEQSGEAAIIPPEREYATLDEFVSVNNRRGTVRVSTYTARGAFPVAGARVVISQQIGGKKHVFYALTTDISGVTPVVTLPAPPKELSETPGSEITPYATYNMEITADGYNEVVITNMPLFEGVLSQQRVALVPALGQPVEVIPESEPDLNGGA